MQLQSQVILIIGIAEFSAHVSQTILACIKSWNLQHSEFERLFDWTVTESFQQILNVNVFGHITLNNHYRNDIYKCIYDEIGAYVEGKLSNVLDRHGILFKPYENVKIMVTFNEIIIVKTKKE